MKRVFLFSVVLTLLASVAGSGSPLGGSNRKEVTVSEMANVELEEKFRGGERACVIVRGDHDPVVNLGLFVYDDKGSLVGKDDGGGDIVAVIWYPPRDATYKIKLRNPGKVYNKCLVSFK
jgi:hypothetical protein